MSRPQNIESTDMVRANHTNPADTAWQRLLEIEIRRLTTDDSSMRPRNMESSDRNMMIDRADSQINVPNFCCIQAVNAKRTMGNANIFGSVLVQ